MFHPILMAITFSMVLLSCTRTNHSQYTYQRPAKTSDGIAVGTLEEVNLDTTLIIQAVNKIRSERFGEVHSMLIYKDGKLVLEEYFPGHGYKWDAPKHIGEMVEWDKDELHHVHSVSKSVTSICIGIAIKKGFINSVHQSIFDYLPEHQYLKTDDNQYITIEHLLTGTSGLQWAEWNAPLSSIENDQIAIWFHEKGPVDFVLSRPMIAAPGTHFIYSGGNIEVLGVILENASGMSFEDFSRDYLFAPLGIDSAYWAIIYPTGEVHAAAGLRITPRNMVKIGVAMLDNGVWNGRQAIPVNWIEKSMYPYDGNGDINIPGEDLKGFGYSYTWWTKELTHKGKKIHWYSANGWGGQKIIVLPEIRSVVVFTGANYTSKVMQYRIMENYILPAFE